MKKILLGLGVVIVVVGITRWYQSTKNPVENKPSVTVPTNTSTLPTSQTSTDQAELYLEQSEEGIIVLEELGVK